jgi:hypothetical protein
VTFEYHANGSVKQANQKRVKGDFPSVDLRLAIEEVPSGTILYEVNVTSSCSLKALIKKGGEQGKARLQCKLGDRMADLGLNLPANSEYRQNVENAFSSNASHVKVSVDQGKLKVTNTS